MANVRNGNTYYVDTAANVNSVKTLVRYVVVTSTSANATVEFQDTTATVNKMKLSVAASGTSELFNFDAQPVLFPGGVKVTTITNCVLTLVVSEN